MTEEKADVLGRAIALLLLTGRQPHQTEQIRQLCEKTAAQLLDLWLEFAAENPGSPDPHPLPRT